MAREARPVKTQVPWNNEEVSLLKEHGANASPDLFPRHTRMGIRAKGRRLGFRASSADRARHGRYARSHVNEDNLCFADQAMTFMSLGNDTRQVLLGSLLGDGCVKNRAHDRNYIFNEVHKSKQLDYTDWKATRLAMFLPKTSRAITRDGAPRSDLWTVQHPIFTTLRHLFYPRGRHVSKTFIHPEVGELLDLYGLLIWYLDDGTRGGQRQRAYPSIAAKGWDEQDLVRIAEALNARFGLHLHIRKSKHRDGINKQVFIPAIDRDVLMPKWRRMAAETGIPQCMWYKLEST
jgi:hypothetical protein